METISLNGTWQLRGKRQEGKPLDELLLQANVPGCVQLDLSAAGYLPADLYMGENILQTQKYEGYEWWYTRTFTVPQVKEDAFLVFEGVDCIAEYFLNGIFLGESHLTFNDGCGDIHAGGVCCDAAVAEKGIDHFHGAVFFQLL